MVERFRVVITFLVLIFSSGIRADEHVYYSERLTVKSIPSRICLNLILRKGEVVEKCDSISLKIGSSEEGVNILILHDLSEIDILSVDLYLTLLYFEDGELISTKLSKLLQDQILRSSSREILEKESKVLSMQVESQKNALGSLQGQFERELSDPKLGEKWSKLVNRVLEERERRLANYLVHTENSVGQFLSQDNRSHDLRGFLTEELKRIVEGRVK